MAVGWEAGHETEREDGTEPASLGAINHQNETNIRNIRPVQRAFGFVVLFGGMYGSLAPLIAAFVRAKRERTPLSFLLIAMAAPAN